MPPVYASSAGDFLDAMTTWTSRRRGRPVCGYVSEAMVTIAIGGILVLLAAG